MTGVPDSLLVRTARGAGWVVAWQMLNRVLGIASMLILARLHELADFALGAAVFVVAMATMWPLAGSPMRAETNLLTLLSRMAGCLRLPRATPIAARGG